jgi:hypothetical protein
MMIRVIALAASVWLSLGAAWAGTKEGVTLPDTVEVDGKKLVLNGMGVREATVFNVNVYVAGLYLESKTSDANAIIGAEQAKRIDLVFVRDVDRKDITGAFVNGFKKNGADVEALKADLGKLNSWMQDMKKRDVMTFTYVPEQGTTVTVKGQVKGTIEGAAFGRGLFSNFLGPKPPNGGLKKGLLGK